MFSVETLNLEELGKMYLKFWKAIAAKKTTISGKLSLIIEKEVKSAHDK